MANVGEISASMTLDANDFGSNLDRAKAEVRTFGHTVDAVGSSVRGFLGGFAAYKVGGFLVDAAKQAAHAEEAVNGFAVIFGKRADDVEAFSRKMADDFSISINSILDAEGKVGSIFQGAGLGESQVAEFSKNIGALAVDYARFKNTTVQTSFDKILSGLAGEAEPLRAFGIFLNEASVKAKALQLGLGDLHGVLTEGEKIQARYALIMDKGQVAMGSAAREAEGAAAKFEALSGAWENLKVSFGEVIAPGLAAGFGVITESLNAVREATERLTKDKALEKMTKTLTDRGGLGTMVDVADAFAAALAPPPELARKLPSFKDALKGSPLFDAAQWAELEATRIKKPTDLFAGAALRGSSDAASTIFRSKFGGGGEKAAEKTEVNTRTTAANTAKLIEGISVMTGKLDALKTSPSPDW